MSKLLTLFLILLVCPLLLAEPLVGKRPPEAAHLTIFLSRVSDPVPIQSMQIEVQRILEPAGIRIEWKNWTDRRAGEDYTHLASIEFQGDCSPAPVVTLPGSSRFNLNRIAWTAVANGNILPFATIECGKLRELMSPAIAMTGKEQRREVFGRAMGRLIAHELYHMLMQTEDHHQSGISKSCFRLADLTEERFDFAQSTVAQLTQKVSKPSPTLTAPADLSIAEQQPEEVGR